MNTRDREGNGTLDYPYYWGVRDEGLGSGNNETQAEALRPEYQAEGGRAVQLDGRTCPGCGQWNEMSSLVCGSCGAELGKRKIVDMRHTLEGAPRVSGGARFVQGLDAQRVKTSYKSGVLSARTEREGIKPVPTPFIPPAVADAGKTGSTPKYNLILAVSFIVLIVVMIIVFALLIAKYL